MLRNYETMYILRPELTDQAQETAIAKYQTLLLEKGAESLVIQLRGKRRLAYEIKRHREGFYVQMNYSAVAGSVEVMEKFMRIDEDILRFLTLKVDPEEVVVVAEPAPIEEPAPAVERVAPSVITA